MNTIQGIFNNREIAIGLWVIVAVILLLFTKAARQFLKTALPILFCKKFVVFYIVFLSYLAVVLYVLNWAEWWDFKLLKDTIFWVLFVELPLFTKAIEKADGTHFFRKLLKDNVAISVIIEFFVGFWTFSLTVELIIVPSTVLISALYAIASMDKKHLSAKRFFEVLFAVWGVVIFINAISCLFISPGEFFSLDTLKSLLLPLVLLIFNLPVVYGLALYNMYEQVFIRVKGIKQEQRKMKWQVIRFAGLSLSRIAAVRKNLPTTIVFCKTSQQLKINLTNLSKRLDLQIGDNYMKRSRYYLWACIIGAIISLIGLIGANSNVSLKDLVTLNFVLDDHRIKEILTYIFSTALVFSLVLLIYAVGFNKKQREDITQIKKYALYELICAVKRQETALAEYPPFEEPDKLYDLYVLNAYDVRIACDKVLAAYENFLTTWEQETIRYLQLSAMTVSDDFGIKAENAVKYTKAFFCDYYNTKVRTAPQNEKINTYIHTVKTDLEKYSTRVKQFCEDFKYCY